MVAATAARGLSKAELESIRSTLASGRKPRVVFTEAAGQIVGQVGQVVDLLDPSDDEWIVVRFGRDELPFSPADLKVAPKTQVKRVPKPVPVIEAGPAEAESPEPEAGPVPADAVDAGVVNDDRSTAVIPPPRQEVPMPADTSTVDESVEVAAVDGKPPRKATKAAKPKPLASLVVTIAYTEGEWTVAAQQGSKALAKPYLIKATEALQLVAMLDVPGVHEAVEHIVEAERSETQAHAVRLRAELAEIEARLADLPSTR